MNKIERYVDEAFPDAKLRAPETLTMELKTSWVEKQSVDNPSNYVTIKARIPDFVRLPVEPWLAFRAGTRVTELALVGIHIVGTVENHPEFVWATFEHINNAPNAAYHYMDTGGSRVKQPYAPGGDYLFAKTDGPRNPANKECMAETISGRLGLIQAKENAGCSGNIEPSHTVRTFAWGSKDRDGNPVKPVVNNTRVLSINKNIRQHLAKGDVRANYIQVGGIWTSPSNTQGSDAPIPRTNAFETKDIRGSLSLSNATMETYHQKNTSCFSCHAQRKAAKNSFQPFQLSHIFSTIAPLPASDGASN